MLALAALAVGYLFWIQPKTFEDCILKSMPGTTSDTVALMITKSCREKFPDSPPVHPNVRALNVYEKLNISGRAGLDAGPLFGGTLYNGNDNLTITQVEVQITTTIGAKSQSRAYNAKVMIPPKSTGSFAIEIIAGDLDAKYSWGIESAKGFDETFN